MEERQIAADRVESALDSPALVETSTTDPLLESRADNESIDADLAREYAATHEGED
jgi:hypothetical protein